MESLCRLVHTSISLTLQPCKTMRCCVLSCSVATTAMNHLSLPGRSLLSSVLFLPGLLFLHRCPCACRCWLGAAFRRALVHLSMSVCASAFRLRIGPCLAPCLSSRRVERQFLRLSFRLRPCYSLRLTAFRFVYAYVHVSRPAFRPRVRQCLTPLSFSSIRVCMFAVCLRLMLLVEDG